MSVGWSEHEARAAIAAYFNILEAERVGKPLNKKQTYRALSERFPNRGVKAFELKFQNISAILYEQRLPYCSGLKPRFNYQRLLRLLVLDQLDRSPLPPVEPHEILFSKLREIRAKGPIVVAHTGPGRFGLAVEAALGISQNSDKAADFMGIELKTKSDKSLQTLFSRTPSRYIEDLDKLSMFGRHSYFDNRRSRRALYTSFNNKADSLGFRLSASSKSVTILRKNITVLEYSAELIEEALLSKHSQTAFLLLKRCGVDGQEACTLEAVQYCKWPSVIKFLEMVDSGDVYLDFTMSEDGRGGCSDHGFLWRVRSRALDQLYLFRKEIGLGNDRQSAGRIR